MGRFDPEGSPQSSNFEGAHFYQKYSVNEEFERRFLMKFEQGQMDLVCERYCLLKFWVKNVSHQ